MQRDNEKLHISYSSPEIKNDYTCRTCNTNGEEGGNSQIS
jgi:hypothetical protein